MDWTPGGLSSDVEDRRGSGGGGFSGGGLGLVGFLILLVISLVTGRNYIGRYLGGGGAVASHPSATMSPGGRSGPVAPGTDRPAELVSWTFGDVQRTWEKLLPKETGRAYRPAKVVLYDNYTYSGCGTAQSQTGPFYCPADEKVYIDLSFWNELKRLGGSNAEFAQELIIVATQTGTPYCKTATQNRTTGTASFRAESLGAKSSLGGPGTSGRLPRRRVGPRYRTTQDSERRGHQRRSASSDGRR